MIETVQFRIQLPVALRDRFKAICTRSNVTMTDRVVGLIEREVDGLGRIKSADAAPKIATLNDDRLIARVIDAADRLGATAASLGSGLGKTLDGFQDRLLQAIPKPLTPSQIGDIHQTAAATQAKHNEAIISSTAQLHEQILARLDLQHDDIMDTVATKRRPWQAAGVGAVIGIGLTFALLWSINGSSPARSLAVWLTGEDSDLQAAQAIAGDGSVLHGRYISETHALLKIPEFRDSYTRCVERAKTRKTNFNCTVRFTLLREVR
jgi:hypothetical protein